MFGGHLPVIFAVEKFVIAQIKCIVKFFIVATIGECCYTKMTSIEG
jgi:hypothetical protein